MDYHANDVRLHKIGCKYCYPRNKIGVKPKKKTRKGLGEFWYSDKREELMKKARKIAVDKWYNFSTCSFCDS